MICALCFRLTKELDHKNSQLNEVKENYRRELSEKDQQLEAERTALEAEKHKNVSLQVCALGQRYKNHHKSGFYLFLKYIIEGLQR